MYFQEIKAIKRVRYVKFTDSYENSLLPEPDEDEQMVLSDYISNKYKEKHKEQLNIKEERLIHNYPTREKEKNDSFVVENFEFRGIDYCYTMHTIPTNYTEAISSEESEYWVSAMPKKF